MLYRLKKDIRPTENIAFFDSDKNEFVDGFYVENGVIGELIDQGKSCNKRHLTFWFDREKSIEFFGILYSDGSDKSTKNNLQEYQEGSI